MTQPTEQTSTAQPAPAPSPQDPEADDNLEEEVTRERKQPDAASQPGGENTPTNASPENLAALERASQATASGEGGEEGEGAEGTRVLVATNDPSALRAELDAAAREGRPAQLEVAPPASTWGPGIERSYAPLAETVAPPAPVPSPDDPDLAKGQLAFRMQNLRNQGWSKQAVTNHIANVEDRDELVRISEVEQERLGELRADVRTALANRARELAAEARERQTARQESGRGNVVVPRGGARAQQPQVTATAGGGGGTVTGPTVTTQPARP